MVYEGIYISQILVTPLGYIRKLKFHNRSTIMDCIDIEEELRKHNKKSLYFENITVMEDRSIYLTGYDLQSIFITIYHPSINTEDLEITEVYYEHNTETKNTDRRYLVNKLLIKVTDVETKKNLHELGVRETEENIFELINIELKRLISNSITLSEWFNTQGIIYLSDDIVYKPRLFTDIKPIEVENTQLETWINKAKLLNIIDKYTIDEGYITEYSGKDKELILPPVRHIKNVSYKGFNKYTVEKLIIPPSILSLKANLTNVEHLDLSKAINLHSVEGTLKQQSELLKPGEYVVDLKNIVDGIVVMNPFSIKANGLYFRNYTNTLDKYCNVIITSGIIF